MTLHQLTLEERRQLRVLYDVWRHPEHAGVWSKGVCEDLVDKGLAVPLDHDGSGITLYLISDEGVALMEGR